VDGGDASLWVQDGDAACDTGLAGAARGSAYSRTTEWGGALLFAAVPAAGDPAADAPALHSLPLTRFASTVCTSGGVSSLASDAAALFPAVVHSPADMKVCDGRLLFSGVAVGGGSSARRLWAMPDATSAPEPVGNATLSSAGGAPAITCGTTDTAIVITADGAAAHVTVPTGLTQPIPLAGGAPYTVTSAVTLSQNRACYAADVPSAGGSALLCTSLASRPLVAGYGMRPALARPAPGTVWMVVASLTSSSRLLLRCVAPSSPHPQLCAVDASAGSAALVPTVAALGAALRWDSLATVASPSGSRVYFTASDVTTGAYARYLIDTATDGGLFDAGAIGGGGSGARRLLQAPVAGAAAALPRTPSLTRTARALPTEERGGRAL
jgi:hypothetical protein